MNNRKKVLLIDTTLHQNDATGITLSNLFSVWPKEKLFMIGDHEMASLSIKLGYKNIYILTQKEYSHRFPIGFIKRIFTKLVSNNSERKSNVIFDTGKNHLAKEKKFSVRNVLFKLFVTLGLDHYFIRKKTSKQLISWIKNIDPDYFYAVLSTSHSINFANNLVTEFRKPLIIHIMDDWPKTIGNESIFYKFWNRKINIEFKKLLQNTYKKIAISQAMAHEYHERFGGEWEYFHNPIDTLKWLPFQKQKIKYKEKSVKFAYFGRIGRANESALYKFIDALNEIEKQKSNKIQIDIYSSSVLPEVYGSLDFVSHKGFIEHTKVPETVCEYDFLILPLSFELKDVSFARLSIPTKFSEYLISGVPVVVLAPKETTLSIFAHSNLCSFVINSNNVHEISSSLNNFIDDIDLQKEVSSNGKKVAFKKFSNDVVIKTFDKLFD